MFDSQGDLFGSTGQGEEYSVGAVFEIAAGSSTDTTLASFTGKFAGEFVVGDLVVDSSGNLFGTTGGTVFEIAAGSGTITTLAAFNHFNGSSADGALVEDRSGNLFGTTSGGGLDDGTVFEVAAGSGIITTLAFFNGTNGTTPSAGLVEDTRGNLFGTTEGGGAAGYGTVFEIAAGTGTITTLASFNDTNGSNPIGQLLEDGNGDLFGTTDYGGASATAGTQGLGTVFEVAAGSGTITTLVSFNGTNGANPHAGLIEDGSGNILGMTPFGGAADQGTAFAIAAGGGTFTTLASFGGASGGNPYDGLTEDSNGDLFGTTFAGGGYVGQVFEITALPVSITVGQAPAFTGTTAATSPATTGTAYSFQYTATGNANPSFSLGSGALPGGITLSSAGLLSGTPNTVGTFSGVVDASNGIGSAATDSFTIVVKQVLVFTGATAAASPETAGMAYAFQYTVNSFPAASFTVSSGMLPNGLMLSADGAIAGTPTRGGVFNGVVTAANGVNFPATETFSIVVDQRQRSAAARRRRRRRSPVLPMPSSTPASASRSHRSPWPPDRRCPTGWRFPRPG